MSRLNFEKHLFIIFRILESIERESQIKYEGLQYLKRENARRGFNQKIIGINHHVSNIQPIMKWFGIRRDLDQLLMELNQFCDAESVQGRGAKQGTPTDFY